MRWLNGCQGSSPRLVLRLVRQCGARHDAMASHRAIGSRRPRRAHPGSGRSRLPCRQPSPTREEPQGQNHPARVSRSASHAPFHAPLCLPTCLGCESRAGWAEAVHGLLTCPPVARAASAMMPRAMTMFRATMLMGCYQWGPTPHEVLQLSCHSASLLCPTSRTMGAKWSPPIQGRAPTSVTRRRPWDRSRRAAPGR